MDGRIYGRTVGSTEIAPCVIQNIVQFESAAQITTAPHYPPPPSHRSFPGYDGRNWSTEEKTLGLPVAMYSRNECVYTTGENDPSDPSITITMIEWLID